MNPKADIKMKGLIAIIVSVIVIIILPSCRSIQYVPVESNHTDSTYRNKTKRDSIYIQDCIYVEAKGDTIFKIKYQYRYVYKHLTDTMYIERVDSINVPYPVEKELSAWEKLKLDIGGIAIGGIAVGVFFVILWIIKKKTNV